MTIITGRIESYDESNIILKGHKPIFLAPENRVAAKKNFPVGTAVKLTHMKGTATAMENMDNEVVQPEGAGSFQKASELKQDAKPTTTPPAPPADTTPSATEPTKDEKNSKDSSTKPAAKKAEPKKSAEKKVEPPKAGVVDVAGDAVDKVVAKHEAAKAADPIAEAAKANEQAVKDFHAANQKEQAAKQSAPKANSVAAKETKQVDGEMCRNEDKPDQNASSSPTKGLSTVTDEIESVTLGVSLRFGAYNNIKVEVTARTPTAADIAFRSLVETQKAYIMRTIVDIMKKVEEIPNQRFQ
jgi:transcriptional regulator of acetoin/glycerol metabolism